MNDLMNTHMAAAIAFGSTSDHTETSAEDAAAFFETQKDEFSRIKKSIASFEGLILSTMLPQTRSRASLEPIRARNCSILTI